VRVSVDADLCTGHGRCYALAPELFGADDFGHCEPLVADGAVAVGSEDAARTGRDNCPEQAITIEE